MAHCVFICAWGLGSYKILGGYFIAITIEMSGPLYDSIVKITGLLQVLFIKSTVTFTRKLAVRRKKMLANFWLLQYLFRYWKGLKPTILTASGNPTPLWLTRSPPLPSFRLQSPKTKGNNFCLHDKLPVEPLSQTNLDLQSLTNLHASWAACHIAYICIILTIWACRPAKG